MELIQAYLAQHPDASFSEIGNLLGVSKQRAYQMSKVLVNTNAPLTERELTILRYIASGNTNKQIAQTFGVTESTIKNQVTTILAKLNANNRTHAAISAMQQGIISVEELKLVKTASKQLLP